MFPPPQSVTDWFPAGPVRPSHGWILDARKLTRLLGPAIQFESGTWKLAFEGTVREGGVSYARIAEDIDVTGRMRDEHGEWVRVTLAVAGTTLRPLGLGGVETTHLWGTVRITGRTAEGGQSGNLTMDGPVTVESRTRRK